MICFCNLLERNITEKWKLQHVRDHIRIPDSSTKGDSIAQSDWTQPSYFVDMYTKFSDCLAKSWMSFFYVDVKKKQFNSDLKVYLILY